MRPIACTRASRCYTEERVAVDCNSGRVYQRDFRIWYRPAMRPKPGHLPIASSPEDAPWISWQGAQKKTDLSNHLLPDASSLSLQPGPLYVFHRQQPVTNLRLVPPSSSPIIYVINVNSLAKPHAKEQLTADLMAYNAGIALITETKLKQKHKSNAFRIEGYQFFRHHRPGRGGGGVAIYIADELKASLCPVTSPNPDLELLWIRVDATTTPLSLFVGVLYHPPNTFTRLANCSITSRKPSRPIFHHARLPM